MAVRCQNLTLGALSSRSALSVLVGALFKKLSLFEHVSYVCIYVCMCVMYVYIEIYRYIHALPRNCILCSVISRHPVAVCETPTWECDWADVLKYI